MKSRAAVLFEVGQGLEIREVDVQDPDPGEVRIQMVAGGICHSDLHVMTGHLNAPLPAILGHEGAGIVADVGAGVTSVRPGDHVIPLWRLSCGECEYCTGGRPALCPAGTEIRWSGRLLDGTTRFKLDGQEIKHFGGVSSFSNYTVIPEKAVLKIPEDLPLEQAALLGCAVITGVGAVVNAAQVKLGRTVAVFGTGGVGINVVQGAVLVGAEKIIAVDLLESRLAHAKQFGATAHLMKPKVDTGQIIGVKRFAMANEETVEWINANPEKTKQVYSKFLKNYMGKTLPDEIIDESFSNLIITSDPLRKSVFTFAERADSLGYLGRSGYDISEIFYDDNISVKSVG